MKPLIIALTATLSAPAPCSATDAQPARAMLVAMTDPAIEGPATDKPSPAGKAEILRVTYSGRSLSKRSVVPPPLRKLDFHSAHTTQQLGGRGFDWTPGGDRK
ncbi:hypothetical protein ACT2FY_36355 [Paraburkholderia fungorum]|uniref:hypothetical protein n=1 Tax=Paraburkholderia fungorum TaxID=134537 RepID=UPI00402B21A5